MRRLVPALLTLAVLAAPASAQAGFFASEVIDGPGADLQSGGDVDVARDGGGGVLYLKRDQGIAHVFLSRLVDGAFQPPQRMDADLPAASSAPVFAAGQGGRLALAYVNDGKLWAAIQPSPGKGFAAPQVLAEGDIANPSIDISVNGAVYVAWQQGGDVRAARAARDTVQFTVLDAPLDINPARPATRPRVAVSADGTAVVVWQEPAADGLLHVFARRLFELRLSQSPQDLNLADVEGSRAGDASSPELDIEDDSSYAQVVFVQSTASRPRLVMRRLVGSQFEAPLLVDGGGSGRRARIDMTGRGEALIGTTVNGTEAYGATLWEQGITSLNRLDGGSGVEPLTMPALGENEDGGLVWLQGTSASDAVVRARYFDSGLEGLKRIAPLPDATISNPAFGGADPAFGLDAAATRAGDVAAVFVQASGEGLRLVAGFFDKPPSRPIGYTTTSPRRLTTLAWSPSINVLGPAAYRVLVDGEEIGKTSAPSFRVPPGAVGDGRHRWQVIAVDRRLQEVPSQTRRLRVDNTPPVVGVAFRRKGRALTVLVRARDTKGALPTGVNRIVLDPGTGRFFRIGARYRYVFRSGGAKDVRVRVFDKAGNATTVERRVRVG